jgi:shikimate dehydrogenase
MKKEPLKQVYDIADLRNWTETTRRVKPPIRLAAVGDPVAHSLSPEMQNAALRDCGIDMQYARLHIRGEDLSEAITRIRQLGFVGLNITLPHKGRVLGLLDEIEPNAHQVGAVNTVLGHDERLIGFNTDGIGFSRAVREVFSVDLRDLRILLLGAGGAAQAIAVECGRENCERLVIANRTRTKADRLVEKLQQFFTGPRVLGPVPRLQAIDWNESGFRAQIPHTDLLVNATPSGLKHSDPSPVPSHLLAPHLMIYDTIYSLARTPLLVAATNAGARGSDGASMLLHQGARAFELWFGREAPIPVMRKALTDAAAAR